MTVCASLVSCPCHDHRSPHSGDIIDKCLKQRIPAVGPIAVAKTDIDRDRHIVLQGFSQDIIQSHHKLRRPGKGIRRGIPEFYNDKITLRCHPRIASAGCPAIACRNAGHMCPMTGDIPAWTDAFPLRRFFACKRRIDRLSAVLRPYPVGIRCRSRSDRLIPQRKNPCRAIRIPEIRMRVINPAVKHRDEDPPAS